MVNGIKALKPSLLTLENNHIIVKKKNVVRLAEGQAGKNIRKFLCTVKKNIKRRICWKKYETFSKNNIDSYIRSFWSFGKWLSRIDCYLLKGKLLKHKYDKNKLLAMQNFIECEAHRELLLKGINKKTNNRI